MKKIEASFENFTALESAILNNKTLKAAFYEFAQNDYTFEQVRGFYYKYKTQISNRGQFFYKCHSCGIYHYPSDKELLTTNKYSHYGLRRVIDAIFTLGFSESITSIAYICPYCGELNIIRYNQ